MGWIVIKAGGNLSSGPDKEFERVAPTTATNDERAAAFDAAHAFVEECRAAAKRYDDAPTGDGEVSGSDKD